MKIQPTTFFIKFTYLDDSGKRRTKSDYYAGFTVKEAIEKLRHQFRSAKEIDILSWEIKE